MIHSAHDVHNEYALVTNLNHIDIDTDTDTDVHHVHNDTCTIVQNACTHHNSRVLVIANLFGIAHYM